MPSDQFVMLCIDPAERAATTSRDLGKSTNVISVLMRRFITSRVLDISLLPPMRPLLLVSLRPSQWARHLVSYALRAMHARDENVETQRFKESLTEVILLCCSTQHQDKNNNQTTKANAEAMFPPVYEPCEVDYRVHARGCVRAIVSSNFGFDVLCGGLGVNDSLTSPWALQRTNGS